MNLTQELVNECNCFSELTKKLGKSPHSRVTKQLKSKLDEMNISYSHFTKNGSKKKIKVEKQNPILICVFDEKYMDYYVKILNLLRTKNISAEIYSGSANIKSQLKYADKRGCNYVILCGDDEVSKNAVTIKNLEIGKQMSDSLKDRDDWKESSGSQKTVALDQLLNEIK